MLQCRNCLISGLLIWLSPGQRVSIRLRCARSKLNEYVPNSLVLWLNQVCFITEQVQYLDFAVCYAVLPESAALYLEHGHYRHIGRKKDVGRWTSTQESREERDRQNQGQKIGHLANAFPVFLRNRMSKVSQSPTLNNRADSFDIKRTRSSCYHTFISYLSCVTFYYMLTMSLIECVFLQSIIE